jgi:hypothetical protein
LTVAQAGAEKPVFPGAEWQVIDKPEDAGYSSPLLEVLRMLVQSACNRKRR